MTIDWKAKYESQLAITESLKRDLAALQARTIMPCPAADKMGEHACTNQHECWEPCGVMGNDERFARAVPIEEAAKVDDVLGLARTKTDCVQMFKGAKIVAAGTPPTLEQRVAESEITKADINEPLGLPISPPAEKRRGERRKDSGQRRRKTD